MKTTEAGQSYRSTGVGEGGQQAAGSTGKEVTAAQSDTDIWGSYGLILAEYGQIFSSTLLSVIAAQ